MTTPLPTQRTSISPSIVNCAVIHAGNEVLLAIEAREGRYPVNVIQTSPIVQWIGHDGLLEQLGFSAPYGEADRARLSDEIMGHGLLVAEFRDMTNLGDDPASHWLMGTGHVSPRERAS